MKASRSFTYSGLLAGFVLASACSKSGSGSGGNAGTTGGDACTQNALTILFNPMYSAYDGVHTFQLPAIVNGIDPANVKITWSVADPSMVQLDPDPATGRVMMTMQKAGKTTVSAQAGGLCGSARLTITAATPDDWKAGSTRYNDGVVLTGGGSAQSMDGAATAQQAACTNCHGDTANNTFKDVAHTPEQTGGFSDDELTDIFTRGMVPSGGYFDPTIVPYGIWQLFHQWDVGNDAKGVVVYLRSLTPATQKGSFNVGALLDGGVPDGGFRMPDDGGSPGSGGAGEGGSGGSGGSGGRSGSGGA